MSVKTEFPREYWPPEEVINTLTQAGFTDHSWHNDEYPSWRYGETPIDLFVNVADQDTPSIYCVLSDDADICFETNVLSDAIAHYERYLA